MIEKAMKNNQKNFIETDRKSKLSQEIKILIQEQVLKMFHLWTRINWDTGMSVTDAWSVTLCKMDEYFKRIESEHPNNPGTLFLKEAVQENKEKWQERIQTNNYAKQAINNNPIMQNSKGIITDPKFSRSLIQSYQALGILNHAVSLKSIKTIQKENPANKRIAAKREVRSQQNQIIFHLSRKNIRQKT